MFQRLSSRYGCTCNVLRYVSKTSLSNAGMRFCQACHGVFCFILQAANDFDLEPVACEFFTQAYILYEEEISVQKSQFMLQFLVLHQFVCSSYSLCSLCVHQGSREQVTALYLIIGTLQRMHVFGVENRDTLTHKATGVI